MHCSSLSYALADERLEVNPPCHRIEKYGSMLMMQHMRAGESGQHNETARVTTTRSQSDEHFDNTKIACS